MGAKSLYVDMTRKIIANLINSKDFKAIEKLFKDQQEYLKFYKGWQKANLDEYLKNFDITSDKYNATYNKRKISFMDDGKKYEIVCAIGARYFRVLRLPFIDKKGNINGATYVTLDLKEPRIPNGLKGVAAKAERERLTHFRMSYQKGISKI